MAIVDPVALIGLVLDAAIGWPNALYTRIGHPVGAFAWLIERCEARWNRPTRSDRSRRVAGIAMLTLLLALVAGAAWGLAVASRAWLGALGWIAMGAMAWPGLAQRSLDDHVRPVAAALLAGNLVAARVAVGRIVGRDTAGLDEAGVARAAIESLAESFCDGVAAPLFWLIVLGLPGLWAYKALNTADSLVGHREARWRMFGWASARADDIANYLPARMAALVLCMAGGGGIGTMWRDGHRHASPNAGWPEAAMAGALKLRLAGPVVYDGVVYDKEWIGAGRTAATGQDVQRAIAVYRRACLILWLVAGGCAWLR